MIKRTTVCTATIALGVSIWAAHRPARPTLTASDDISAEREPAPQVANAVGEQFGMVQPLPAPGPGPVTGTSPEQRVRKGSRAPAREPHRRVGVTVGAYEARRPRDTADRQTPDTETTSEPDEAPAGEEPAQVPATFEEVEARWEGEREDRSWTEEMTAHLGTLIDDIVPAATLADVKCHSSICSVSIELDDLAQAVELRENLGGWHPERWARMDTVHGRVRARVLLARGSLQ